MKKDLSKYYAEVTAKDAKKVFKIVNNPFVSKKSIQSSIARGYTSFYSYADSEDFVLGKGVSRKRISLKTMQNYIAHNKAVEKAYTEPIELRKLTEENTSLINEVHAIKKDNILLLKEVENKKIAFKHCNDILNKQIEANEKLKKDNYAKGVVIAILSFTLLISWIFITQKL